MSILNDKHVVANDPSGISTINAKEIATFSKIYWKDYLDQKNYDKDINDMCGKCKDKQIAEHGKIVIKCNGLAGAESLIPEDHKHLFSAQEVDDLEQACNPYHWAEKNIDLDNLENPRRRLFVRRWYQEQLSRCTATRKAIRCGRRSGKSYSLALKILHKVLTNKDYKVLVVAPFDVQTEEIFNLIRQFLTRLNPQFGHISNLVVKDIKSPTHFMEFANGSRIRGFTTGSSGAASVRGQAAHLIVLDEVDYMDQTDFNSIIAILADKPDTELWVASTPNGEKILHALSQNKQFKNFHYPSFVIPHYDDDLDRDFREMTDEIGYVQEIMAEFGASIAGVFQTYHIEQCLKIAPKITKEELLANRSNYITIMGCDWNHDKVGTRIYVVAYSSLHGRFFTVERATVSKEGWSQALAVQKIIDLNREYMFDHIYVDEGFGVSQIQFIKQYAYEQFGKLPADHPDLRLAEIVGINFSSSVELSDVITGQQIKRHMKQYLVENTRKVIENAHIVLDPVLDKPLIEQMKKYEEKSRSVTGRITYAASDAKVGDHDLDAFMLALIGFHFEYADLFEHMASTLQIATLSKSEVHGNTQEKIYQDMLYGSLQHEQVMMSGDFAITKDKKRSLRGMPRVAKFDNFGHNAYNDTAPGFERMVRSNTNRSSFYGNTSTSRRSW